MTYFHELPHDERMRIRNVFEDEGDCLIGGYEGEGLVLILPRTLEYYELTQLAHREGFAVLSYYTTALCSDKPPMKYRHDSHGYGFSPNSVWCRAHLIRMPDAPAEPLTCIEERDGGDLTDDAAGFRWLIDDQGIAAPRFVGCKRALLG